MISIPEISKRGSKIIMEKENQRNTGELGAFTNHYTDNAVRARAAGDELRSGQKAVEGLGKQYANCTEEQIGGRAAEVWHKATFKAEAQLQAKNRLEVVVGPKGGLNAKGSADLTVMDNGKNVAEAGLKYRANPSQTTFDQANKADMGRQRICPSDQIKKVKELASERASTNTLKAPEYADTAAKVTDRLSYDGVNSKPLSKAESVELIKKPDILSSQAVKIEASQAAYGGAKMGAGLGLAISTISNTIDYTNGNKDAGEALVCVAADTVKSGVTGTIVGGGSALVRNQMIKSGFTSLAKGSAPVAIACTALDAGVNIMKDLADPYVSMPECAGRAVSHTGKAAVKVGAGWGGAELGATAGSLLGPPGAVVGALIGGFLGFTLGSSFFD